MSCIQSTRFATLLGLWMMVKARRQAAATGAYQAARNLKKQGVPIEAALLMLATR